METSVSIEIVLINTAIFVFKLTNMEAVYLGKRLIFLLDFLYA